ncbi:response regulator [Thiopseudomonas acetoxidans]|uniref:Two-component system response regulator n=1 Tax=Thiopseudomonas acetoxidans TaxID=3041622 RepID=A0ABT7SR16_9GAMM|nr:two-component system response regulator [Thiopseudomonas sp. CY1220]MDM7858638.1 two-component system response regulator [Thiopseudomonas sp. CY1220]
MNRKKHSLLLVDDEATNLQLLRHTLQHEYRLIFAKDGKTALKMAQQEQPDLILLDIMMPDMSGYDLCEQLKNIQALRHVPIIFVTALSDSGDEEKGFALGAVDYITKPFNPAIVKARVRTHLSLVQAEEVLETRLQIVQCLGKAAEYRDNETGMHILRISHFARTIAKAIGFSDEQADELLHAAPMHDVGKIGIPDAILLKPGKLTAEEWEVMRQHPAIGARIIGEHKSSLLQLAATIALCHHEKWDGSGYPNGLAGEDIPLEARIVSLVDVFDALTSVRPYKKAWPIEEALEFIRDQSGSHFDPMLVDVFINCLPEILRIRDRWADKPE